MPETTDALVVCGIPLGATFTSPGRTVTEADIVAYAGMTGDYNELHTNEEFCKTTPYGTRIAHGLLVLGLQSGLGTRAIPKALPISAFLGIKDWNFRKPVFIGDTISVRLTFAAARRSGKVPTNVIAEWHREVLNQRGEVVQDGTTVVLLDETRAT